MCGIVAVIHGDLTASAAADIHDALYLLQHRGQDACGIVTCGAAGRIYQCKGNGMASKVFRDGNRIQDLRGAIGLGHLRYPTAGSSANAEAQPFYVNAPYGISFTHNGNLTNATELREYLDHTAHRHINTDSDSEVMLNIFASELNETGKDRVNAADCFAALRRTYDKCEGGWACAAMIAGYGLIAFRDAYGIRPLCIGSRTLKGGKTSWMIASESVALDFFGCQDIRDILPGQAVIIEKNMAPKFEQIRVPIAYAPDIFEYVYFARPDSVIDGISVQESREKMGVKLAEKIMQQLGEDVVRDIDVVIPIPETANSSARCVADYLKKRLVEGFVKNRYIFRTFIMPTQQHRVTGVRRKLTAMPSKFRDKTVLLVDDSIVRGTTSKEIVQMAREAGSKKVYLASCAPPITHPHIYGIDLASSNELIAFHKSSSEIAHQLGADAIVYQSLSDLKAACAELSPRKDQRFEVGVFCGNYITPVMEGYFEHLEQIRGERKKQKVHENARNAVANGVAKEDELRMVAEEAKMDHIENFAVIHAGHVSPSRARASSEAAQNLREESMVSSFQDVSLDNMNDHER